MNRSALVSALADRSEQPAAAVDAVLKALTAVTAEQLAAGEKVTLPGFITLQPVERAARTGRNPRTGEPLEIAASTGVKATAGKDLKNAVSG